MMGDQAQIGPQGYGEGMNPRNGRDNNQVRDMGPAQRHLERGNRQEEREEGGRKRQREY